MLQVWHQGSPSIKNVAKRHWYMDKMKMQDVQLMQASGDTASAVDDWSSVTGTTPATNGTNSKAQSVKGQRDHLGRACKSTEVELFTPTAMHRPTSTCMVASSSIHCNVHQVNTTLSLAMNAGTMTTNLKAELPAYSTVWLDPQAMTNVLSFGNIAKQYHI